MTQSTTSKKDYTLLPNIIHKQDLWAAKQALVKEINLKGFGKRQYKYTTLTKIS